MGLFAARCLAKGCLIAEMAAPALARKWVTSPLLSGVEFECSAPKRLIKVWDTAIKSKRIMPPNSWYRMNHCESFSDKCNVVIVFENERFKWIARRYIEAGEELLWDYGKNQKLNFD